MFFYLLIGLIMIISPSAYAEIPFTFETERLRAEKVTKDHTRFLETILNNVDVQEAYNTTDEATFTNVSAQMALIENQWSTYGHGLYIIFKKDTNEFIGFAGFHTVSIDDLGIVNCFSDTANFLEAYALYMPAYWQKGYGFEIGTALIKLANKHLANSVLIAYAEPSNTASLQLLKKLKSKKIADVLYNNKPHWLYQLK
jgi:RimJ/RimL family protein N-acetyltransferase